MKKIVDYRHKLHYPILIAMLVLAISLAIGTAYDPQIQMLVIVALTIFYVVWGIFHYAAHHSLTSKIVIEYILMGMLGMTIVLFLLKI